MPYLREPLTYREKIDSDADRRFKRMERVFGVVAGVLFLLLCWLIHHGRIYG